MSSELSPSFAEFSFILGGLAYKRLRAKSGYFDELDRKVLEINLRPNPNPSGNAVRALRYALLKGFRWGPNLTQFIAETIDEFGWNALRENEMRSFKTQYLDTLRTNELQREIEKHVSVPSEVMFEPSAFRRNVQLELPYVH
mgnify:CR=1 FL=1|tara:strand:- start:256 stop:681 length:426 start_codon:yes stop_codon:yes gene_type:complete